VEDLRLLADRQGERRVLAEVGVAQRRGLRERGQRGDLPQVGDRDRVLVVVLGDVGAAGAPLGHALGQAGVDRRAGVTMKREAQGAVVEVAAGSTDDHAALLERDVAQRAGDADARAAVDVDERDGARHAAVGGRAQADGAGDVRVHERVLGEHLGAQRVAEEHAAAERLPLREGRRALAVPQRGGVGERQRAAGGELLRELSVDVADARGPLGQQVPAEVGAGVGAEAGARVGVLGVAERALERAAAVRGIRGEVAVGLRLQPGLAKRRGDGRDGRRGDGRVDRGGAAAEGEREGERGGLHVTITWTGSRTNSGERTVWRTPSTEMSISST
jgi:hypothetical protein